MIVVVGGHARKIGKTAVIAGLIAALPEYRWTALKITHHSHGVASGYTVEEALEAGDNDSGRYLAAGAARSFWVRAANVEDAVPAIRRILSVSGNAIVESNRILRYINADLCLFVFDPRSPVFKDSAFDAFDRADALIVTGAGDMPKHKMCFRAPAPQFMTDEIAAFARGRLGSVDVA